MKFYHPKFSKDQKKKNRGVKFFLKMNLNVNFTDITNSGDLQILSPSRQVCNYIIENVWFIPRKTTQS